ncbi:MAG: hypothetical protein CL582_21845 [Alteromonadaceae bacterium]|nr:hypothetical protein [Alteromonadaceae bacterium]
MELVRKLQRPSFEKTASKFMLGDNPQTYPSELLAQLYKQHSYLGKYRVNMSIEGQDDNLGYLYGVFVVSHSPDVPPASGDERMGEVVRQPDAAQSKEESEKSLRIPIIVESKKGYSFDVFISPDGRFLPLNEERVSGTLFDMNPYIVSPGAQSGENPNIQPDDPMGSLGGQSGGQNASVKQASIIETVSDKIEPSAVERFLHKVAGDLSLKDAVLINESFGSAIAKLAEAAKAPKSGDVPDASVSIDDFDATVISKASGGYVVKMASSDGSAQEVTISNAEGQCIPSELKQRILSDGHALIVPDGNSELLPVEKTASLKTVESSGVYSVMTKSGSAQRAVVINDVTSLDGRAMDLCLVVGKSGASFQEKVAGVRCGDLVLSSLNGCEPSGEGVFIYKESGVVTEPLEVLHRVDSDGEVSYIYDHPIRGQGMLKVASVKKPVLISGNDYLIPDSMTFVPLEFGGRYATDMTSMDKVASREDRMMEVSLYTDGSEFSFSGRPVEGFTKKAGLSSLDAALLLGVLGDTQEGALKKIASAVKNTSISFVSSRKLGGKEKVAVDKEAVRMAEVINIDLIKEAASLTNSDTVDSVLSLNFVTPENIMGYVDSIPVLEDASSKLAELLIGVRLGLSDVPESAVSSSVRGLERAIQGLKKLQMRANVSLV